MKYDQKFKITALKHDLFAFSVKKYIFGKKCNLIKIKFKVYHSSSTYALLYNKSSNRNCLIIYTYMDKNRPTLQNSAEDLIVFKTPFMFQYKVRHSKVNKVN